MATTTEQLMAHHGVAWFDFDEVNGNVIDKLGNGYTGTVTGATRVQGWNGEGSAISFNGTSDRLEFNNKIFPFGEKTISFKIKTENFKTTSQSIMENYTTSSSNSFGYVFVLNSGVISVNWYTSANPLVSSFSLSTPTSINLCDGNWHNILFSWTGRMEDVVKLYIDDELVATARASQSETNATYTGQNLSVGGMKFTSYRNWFGGQIDDLQIYNKTLSPSDFTQKRLVVKTTDSKNLVLSPNTTRVKEIPNTAEYMMLAQGGIVREIDSAVDSTPIDFTKTTTEYEIVTNNKTPLGKSRMFTIPIGGDFKTAMIEDNY
ncbi:hypothetical protein B1B04_09165 [Lysinibacillus sp. KCTC 33748]|uniref:LamG domain-containing protein n=1 Tax=unclassified Lysinibacillus TaxID=2636778 RepID=UPI0009A5B096|nr:MULTISPECIES: LamG domain-containing protein [unclassified Lysinibacillus]OXS74286.1 hypothetical protein B1B04_09165 [Lysinibacillus sp. KCTC 33748]SKB63669.1 Concanavalin A-like lectin/glucanases superfamily protein [Lysinibacillus sp. AC-3]